MKKRSLIYLALFVSGVALMVGCSKKENDESSGNAWTENDDASAIIAEAEEIYMGSAHRGSKIDVTDYYDDETDDSYVVTTIVDTEQGIREERTEYDDVEFIKFNVKDDDDYYVYSSEENGDKWLRYKEEADPEYTEYAYLMERDFIAARESEGFENVQLENAGIEDLDGIKVVRINVSATVTEESQAQADMDDQQVEEDSEDLVEDVEEEDEAASEENDILAELEDEDFRNLLIKEYGEDYVKELEEQAKKPQAEVEAEEEEEGQLTRENLLENYEWTEKQVQLIDGFSEVIDDYIEAEEYLENTASVTTVEQTIWVDVETHKAIQKNTTFNMVSEENVPYYAKISKFNNESWKMDLLIADLESGMSEAEALADIEKEQKKVDAGESELDIYMPQQVKECTLETYFEEENIPELDAIPSEYIELTQEQYFSDNIDKYLNEDEDSSEEYEEEGEVWTEQ